MAYHLTPPPLRGALYSGTLTMRCWAYNACSYCRMCTNYDPNSSMCTYCESRKPKGVRCACSQRQREAARRLSERLGGIDLLNPQRPVDMQVPLDQVNEDLHEDIREAFGNVGVVADLETGD